MGADRNQDWCEVSNRKCELLRHAKLGGRATPEQIGWSCGHGDQIWTERPELCLDVRERQIEHVGVEQQRLVPGRLQVMLGNTKLERQVRRSAAEIDATAELPVGVDEGDAGHAMASRLPSDDPKRLCSQVWSERRPSATSTLGAQPSASDRALVSVTYQG